MNRLPRGAIRAIVSFGLVALAINAPIAALALPPSPPPPTDDAVSGEVPQPAIDTPRSSRSLLRDVASDYRHIVSWESAEWLALGGIATLAVSEADEALRSATEDPAAVSTMALKGGDVYGNLTLQVPLAVAWWAIAHVNGSARGAAAGRDLLRAQISAASWTYAIRYGEPGTAQRRPAIVPLWTRVGDVRSSDRVTGALRLEARRADLCRGNLHGRVANHR